MSVKTDGAFFVVVVLSVAGWLLIYMSQVKSPWVPEVESGVMRQYRPGAGYAAVHGDVSTRLRHCF